MTIKAIIFDMDGVLIETNQLHWAALNLSLAPHRLYVSFTDYCSRFDGLSTKQKLTILGKEHNLSHALLETIHREKQYHTHTLFLGRSTPDPAKSQLLRDLSQHKFRLALASNSIRKSIDLILRGMNLLEYFEFTLSNQDVTHPKPDPEIYNLAIERLKLQPIECLIIEDHPHGVASARASGGHVMPVCGVDEVNFSNIMNTIHAIELRTDAIKPS